MPRLTTQRAYATHIGKSAQYVGKLVTQGKIKLVNGKVNWTQADAVIKAWSRPGRVVGRKSTSAKTSAKKPARRIGARGESDTAKLTKWRALGEKAKAERAELELRELKGELLPASEVLEAERRKNTNIRNSFRGLARSLAQELHRCKSPSEVEQVLLGAIDERLAEIGRDPLRLAPAVTEVEPQTENTMPPPAQPAASTVEMRA